MARSRAVARRGDERETTQLLNEVAGVVTLAMALFALVSFLSFQHGQTNLGGPVGYGLANGLLQAFGRAAYLVPIMLAVLGVRLFRSHLEEFSLARVLAACTLLLSVAVVLGLARPNDEVTRAGGWFGGFLGSLLGEACGTLGAYVVVSVSLLLTLMFTTGSSLRYGTSSLKTRAQQRLGRWRARGGRGATAVLAPANRRRETTASSSRAIIVLGEEQAIAEEKKPRRQLRQEVLPFATGGYSIPTLDLLDTPRHNVVHVDEDALRRGSEILEAKLADFGIQGNVVAVRPGPVITTFEIEPAPGVKVNRIVTLQDDLAMALRAMSVRILAPVPGKAVVGIEVANAKREHVYLREILESELFAQSESTLTLALGKDSTGNPVIADLARMPHVLLAGATGTGKSVSINAMIMSILFKSSPRDVRFVMIDLKMLELSLYEELPHLLVPVVTDPKKAVVVLKNLTEQMDMRYQLLKEKGVRHIDSYNRSVERDEQDRQAGVIELTEAIDDDQPAATPSRLRHEYLPKIVIIIDELADLMMTVGRDVEEYITRLAQKARAAGLHLILATQRPSVDVVTGLIKANFPARISFQVTARVDSRTILDCIGAERLLGGGDMLYLPPGTARVQRLHGAFVSEAEIRRVTEYANRQAQPQYALDLLEGDDEDEAGAADDDGYDDVMYDQAVRLVTESRQASISWVQRRLRVGYNRAARMIERMEREGVVSTSEGGRPREVLARRIDGDD
jgi:S-DNA-T family DNA segregation ATPase FtsK/SpoIIIE